ncbi:MAG: hypothetical protein ACLQJR_15935 [Stellaceae bacterium]
MSTTYAVLFLCTGNSARSMEKLDRLALKRKADEIGETRFAEASP